MAVSRSGVASIWPSGEAMTGLVDRLAKTIDGRVQTIGCERPSLSVLKVLLETAYHSTLRTEEGRFIRSGITYMNPRIRPEDGPAMRRAYYPMHGHWVARFHLLSSDS